ncbi:MAG: ABC transporter substrate-binding protein [Cyanobacteria bacterium P01_F01_bin.42]
MSLITQLRKASPKPPVLAGGQQAIQVGAIASALALTLGSCRPPAPPVASDTLVFGLGGQPVNLTPGNITDGNSIYAQQQIYDVLIGTKPGTTELTPELATDWSASPDGLTWTFNLREDVTFHDGTPFNAEAVVFNINRWWDPEFEHGDRASGNLYEIWPNLFGGFKGDENSTLAEVQAIAPFTVEFSLNQPFAAFPAAIASSYFGIASPTAIKKAGPSYGKPAGAAVGTGPFEFNSWLSGDRIIYSKNEAYWQPQLPKSDRLVISFVEDPAARLAQLRAGRLDFTVDLTPDQLTEIERESAVQPIFRPSFNVGYLALNPSYEPLSKPQVRQAIAQALNKAEIVEAFWGELGKTNGHFLPPALEEFTDSEISDYDYNPKAALKAIHDAGYPDGFELDLWYMPVSRPYFPNPKPIAEAFAAELSDIGIRVNLQTKDWGAYLEDRNTGPGFQSFMLGWTGDYGDPDNFLYAHFGPGATQDLGNYQNQKLFDLLKQARSAQDFQTRQSSYQQIDSILFEEALRIPIVHSKPLMAHRTGLTGWQPSPLGIEDFANVEK